MALKRSILVSIVALAVPLAALAHGPKDMPDDPELLNQYRAGFAAYQKNDYAIALEKWRPLAKQGSAAAQLFLGFMYANGHGVARDNAASPSCIAMEPGWRWTALKPCSGQEWQGASRTTCRK